MTHPTAEFSVNVDLTNPGEFFACCGLLELADRLWPGAEGWFDVVNQRFCVRVAITPNHEAPCRLIDALAKSELSNTMTSAQLQRRTELASMTGRERKTKNLEDEKKALDKAWRESAIVIHAPFCLRIDWFLDKYAGGTSFKTWAGQQSVIDIAAAMKAAFRPAEFDSTTPQWWFSERSDDGSAPFNLDATLGSQGSALDIGFSRDPLGITTVTRPLVELLAFIGLQRFRPAASQERNRYRYSVWIRPSCPELAGAISSGCIRDGEATVFEFGLLYRTKYLKSFLPATPIGASS